MANMFVVSDIHGMHEHLLDILKYWNEEDHLVFLGDYVDRGTNSYGVLNTVMTLHKQFPEKVHVMWGNHEQLFISALKNPELDSTGFLRNGGVETLTSFLHQLKEDYDGNAVKALATIRTHFREEIRYINSLNYYTIIGDVLFTHAGFLTEDLNKTMPLDFLWVREHYTKPNTTKYVNVFGHTPVRRIHASDDVWVSEDKKYIGIDGGCFGTGQLNAILISPTGELLDTYKVKSA